MLYMIPGNIKKNYKVPENIGADSSVSTEQNSYTCTKQLNCSS